MTNRYSHLLDLLRRGGHLDNAGILAVLAENGRSVLDLARDLLASERASAGPPRCSCGVVATVRTSRRVQAFRIQYWRCAACGNRGRRNVPHKLL